MRLRCTACGCSRSDSIGDATETRTIEIPIGKTGEIQVSEIVSRLAKASGVAFDLPAAGLTLSTQGFAGALTRTLLSEALGPEVTISFRPGAMVIAIDERILAAARRGEWLGRLRNLGDRAAEAVRKRQAYGMHALKSFRANDPSRPTICLIHGLNSSSRRVRACDSAAGRGGLRHRGVRLPV